MRNARLLHRPPKSRRRGAACVEFAIVGLPLLILLLGALDVGQYINTSQAVTDAAREGARLATQRSAQSEADVRTRVLDYLAECYPRAGRDKIEGATTVTVSAWERDDFDGNLWTPDTIQSASLADASTGQPVHVQVALAFDSIRWLRGPGFAAGRTFTSKTVMRRE